MCYRPGADGPYGTSFGLLVRALPVVVPASWWRVSSLPIVGPRICWRVAGTTYISVEALFPQNGGSLELASFSSWPRVLVIDAVGGPPHGDFADERSAQPFDAVESVDVYEVLAHF